jgi:hypothetical protein
MIVLVTNSLLFTNFVATLKQELPTIGMYCRSRLPNVEAFSKLPCIKCGTATYCYAHKLLAQMGNGRSVPILLLAFKFSCHRLVTKGCLIYPIASNDIGVVLFL